MEHHKRPTLTADQKKVNAAYASKKYKESMKKKGYTLLYIYVPKNMVKEVRNKVRKMINAFENATTR